jgi:hypothetical protein
MHEGARTAEELELLLEDAFVMRDRDAIGRLFESGAVLSGASGCSLARGRGSIVHATAAMWARDEVYLATPARVLQAGATALIAGERATSVARRSNEGAWRYAIALLRAQPQPERSPK